VVSSASNVVNVRDGTGHHAQRSSNANHVQFMNTDGSTYDSYNYERGQQGAYRNNLTEPTTNIGVGLLPRNQNMSARHYSSYTQSSNVAAAQDMSFKDIPNDVRELMSEFPPEDTVDGSNNPRGSNRVNDENSRVMGVEPQPKFDEIEERFESEFANLTLIEEMIIQDQKRKTLMFQFEHELEKEKRRLESELRRKSIVKEKKDRLSIMSDIGSITAGNNRRDNIGTVSIADTIKLTDKKFKKTIRMQETLRNRFENSVLDLVVDYLRRVDRRPFVQVRGNT
jgi:hypothetical protein